MLGNFTFDFFPLKFHTPDTVYFYILSSFPFSQNGFKATIFLLSIPMPPFVPVENLRALQCSALNNDQVLFVLHFC